MDSEFPQQLNADRSSRLDELLKDMQRDRDRLEGAKNLSMRFVWSPKNHPHPGKLWTTSTLASYYAVNGIDVNDTNGAWQPAGEYFEFLRLPIYAGGDPSECVEGEDAECNVYLPDYIHFADSNSDDEARREFKKHAREARALIERGGGGDDIFANRLVSGLYYWFLGRDQLVWRDNEQPGHPETKSRVAELKDVYALTMLALPGILEASGNADSDSDEIPKIGSQDITTAIPLKEVRKAFQAGSLESADPPAEADEMVFGWSAILTTLKRPVNDEEQRRFRRLNQLLNGPIITDGHPRAVKWKLLEWCKWLASRKAEIDDANDDEQVREHDAVRSANIQTPFGSSGIVAHEIGGSVKSRRGREGTNQT